MKESKIVDYRKYVNFKNILCVFIIICPLLDVISFLFRNTFFTVISPSTIIRPILPILIILFLFFKRPAKFRIKIFVVGLIYAIYGLIHLMIFNNTKMGIAYGGLYQEAQFVINYSFMILNLFIYTYIFHNGSTNKLKKSVIVSVSLYITLIYLSIITNTSTNTYLEGIGYKGWFETGTSIGAILILSLFVILPQLKEKSLRKILIPLVCLMGIFLTTLLGTRVGLYGFVLVIFMYVFVEIFVGLLNKNKINKKIVIGGMVFLLVLVIVIGFVGSSTLERRKHLKDIESDIIDENTKIESHVSKSILEIKQEIEDQTLEEGYISSAQEQSIMDLYNKANDLKLVNNDLRMQQLIFNTYLFRNQGSPVLVIFGNGYQANFRELILEMEIPAFLFNFGIIGLLIYFVPFLSICIYGIYIGIRNIKIITSEYIMSLIGSGFVFVLSLLSGYTFFNSSTMMIVIVIYTILINNILKTIKLKNIALKNTER